jgi:hypothetical protein
MRVITFNILTHDFANKSHYKYVQDRYLDNEYREKLLIKLLKSWIKVNFIINLQEVGEKWDKLLRKFFEKNNYEYISTVYGKYRMGLSIAFPKNHYQLVMSESHETAIFDNLVHNKLVSDKQQYGITPNIVKEISPSLSRQSPMLYVGLICKYMGKITDENIVICNYHMPCVYTSEYYMLLKLWYLKNICYQIVNSKFNISTKKVINNDEDTKKCFDDIVFNKLIFAGDFNLTPESIMYEFLFDNQVNNEKLNEIKKIIELLDFNFEQQIVLQSSHHKCHKIEPNYTNVYKHSTSEFMNCLDYICITNNIKVLSSIVGLLNDDPMKYQYPNAICPSDHVPLSASLELS